MLRSSQLPEGKPFPTLLRGLLDHDVDSRSTCRSSLSSPLFQKSHVVPSVDRVLEPALKEVAPSVSDDFSKDNKLRVLGKLHTETRATRTAGEKMWVARVGDKQAVARGMMHWHTETNVSSESVPKSCFKEAATAHYITKTGHAKRPQRGGREAQQYLNR